MKITWSATALTAMLSANPALHRASALGLPIPWEPLDERRGARYGPRWTVSSFRSLLLMALPDKQAGIRQEVVPPASSDPADFQWPKRNTYASFLSLEVECKPGARFRSICQDYLPLAVA